MEVYLTLICFFFLTLQDGNTGLTNAKELIHTGTEGGNITVLCTFFFSGSRKLFCKGDCTTGNILVETNNDRAQSGRYSIEYEEGSFPSTKTHMYVSITQLKKSDSGWYSCSLLDRPWAPDGNIEIKISVTEASTSSKPNTTRRHFTTSLPSSTTLSSTSLLSSSSSALSTSSSTTPPQSSSSSSATFTPSSFSTETTKQPETGSSAGSGKLLYVSLILLVLIIVLSVAALIFCRKRPRKPKEDPAETAYDSIREDSRVYTEIREDRQNGSPPVEVSTVYSYAKYTKPNRVETTDEYSFVTATAKSAQNKPERNLSEAVYTQVDFLNSPAMSLHRTPGGSADNIIYSAPRVEKSLTNQSNDSSPTLYSTVALH